MTAVEQSTPASSSETGLQKEDLKIFVAGYLFTKMEEPENQELELPESPDELTNKVWDTMISGAESDDPLVERIVVAAKRTCKPMR